MMDELVKHIIRSIVDEPEEVEVSSVERGTLTILEVSVAEHDTGRVIGRGGRVINAIRSVAQIAATKQGQRVTIEVMDRD